MDSPVASPSVRTRRRVAGESRADAAPTVEILEPTIGPWRLMKLLHRGERLMLYRARPIGDELGPGCYVLKTPLVGHEQDALARALLRREAAAAVDASHAHLISTLGTSLGGRRPFVVLPYLDGISLRRLLAVEGYREAYASRSPRAALWMARQLATALAALHAAGWLHGQVRPEHALVSPQGHLTLIDLCQTRRLDSEECAAGLAPPTAPAYAPPEAFATQGRLTAAADVYSLGVLLSELLTGQLPFVARDERHWAWCHCRQCPPDVRERRPSVSRDIAELVRRMLAKEPLRRPAATELADRLAGLEIEELL